MKLQLSSKQAAYSASISIFLMAILAGVTFGYFHGTLIDSSSFDSEVINTMLRNEIIGWIGIVICDFIAAYGLYRYLSFRSSKSANWVLWTRVIYTLILIVATGLLISSQPINGLQELRNGLARFESIWNLGLIIFGIHLVVLGRSLLVLGVKFWGGFLFIAGIGYCILHLTSSLGFGETEWHTTMEMVLSAPLALAELGFAVWLLLPAAQRAIKQ